MCVELKYMCLIKFWIQAVKKNLHKIVQAANGQIIWGNSRVRTFWIQVVKKNIHEKVQGAII